MNRFVKWLTTETFSTFIVCHNCWNGHYYTFPKGTRIVEQRDGLARGLKAVNK